MYLIHLLQNNKGQAQQTKAEKKEKERDAGGSKSDTPKARATKNAPFTYYKTDWDTLPPLPEEVRIEEPQREKPKRSLLDKAWDKVKYFGLQNDHKAYLKKMPRDRQREWGIEEHEMRARHLKRLLNGSVNDEPKIKEANRREKIAMYTRHIGEYIDSTTPIGEGLPSRPAAIDKGLPPIDKGLPPRLTPIGEEPPTELTGEEPTVETQSEKP